jgi:signal transduction histidine kinase
VLDAVTQAASKTIGEACVAWLLSEDGNQLIPESLYHPDQPVRDALREALAVQLAIRDGVTGQVVRTGKALFAPQPAQAQIEMLFGSGYQSPVHSTQVNSLMIVPLTVEGKTTGTLVLTRARPGHPYVEDDFKFFRSLADRAGIAIANVRLYQNLAKALQQEQTLRRQLIQAEKNLALNRMVASVAHEINNPIQTIVNCLYLLRTAVSTEGPDREALDMATSETRRIAGLVQQLRDLYRPGQDKSMCPLEVKEILKEVHKLLLTHLQQHQVAWEAQDIPAGLVFNGIPDHIKQVFLNICLNAVDAMDPDGGKISVKAALDAPSYQVGIAITDTGPGIPPEYLDRLFEPFFTTKTTGTGLGLAITFDIVQSHGGRITVENQPGGGATFTVWLPVL